MSKTRLSSALVNAQADAGATLYNGGFSRIYGGEQPASTDSAVADQPLLVEGRFGDPAWQAAIDGELVAHAMSFGSVLADGDATWVRYFAADGVTVLHDDDAGAIGSGAGIELDTTALVQGAAFEVASLTHRIPRQ